MSSYKNAYSVIAGGKLCANIIKNVKGPLISDQFTWYIIQIIDHHTVGFFNIELSSFYSCSQWQDEAPSPKMISKGLRLELWGQLLKKFTIAWKASLNVRVKYVCSVQNSIKSSEKLAHLFMIEVYRDVIIYICICLINKMASVFV